MTQSKSTRLLTRRCIGVLMGGRSAERTISLKSGKAVQAALFRKGYHVVGIDVNARLPQQLVSRNVKVAFIALHGPGGEDGTVQGLLEIMRIPYTGSSVRANAIAMHKHAAKVLLLHNGIPVPKGVLIQTAPGNAQSSREVFPGLKWPLVVKPATQGSTFGISIVRKASEWRHALTYAFRYDSEVLAEEYIPGREMTVGVINQGGKIVALPPLEIVVPGGFYDFKAKYEKGGTRYLCPAPISSVLRKRLESLALRCFGILGCHGVARVDFRITPRGRPVVLELNTVPGMTETSLLPMAAGQVGMSYEQLTETILASALFRWRSEPPLERGGQC